MTVLLHEADGKVLANRGAARKFLKSRGYTLLWRDAACPRLAGVAKKQL
jgi:nucleotidyltransferase/DNA polymerase involved in DNA repair